MTNRFAIFGSSEDETQVSAKLLKLYKNRTELKKEFAVMRKRQFELQDRIKQEQGETARLQQKLDHLEGLLAKPDWAHNVVVHYQLRGVANCCEEKLARFAEQLKQQHERQQNNKAMARWKQKRIGDMRAIDKQINRKREALEQMQEQIRTDRHRLSLMGGFLRMFKRRSLQAVLDSLCDQIESFSEQERELLEQLSEVENRTPPDNAGLDVPTKRLINLMIFSYAQQLLIQFEDEDLAAVVREAREKSVGAINYGLRYECDKLIDQVEKHVALMDDSADFASVLKKRAKLMGQKARFGDQSDVIPVAGSVSTLYRIDGSGAVQESAANILGENYWCIRSVLAR